VQRKPLFLSEYAQILSLPTISEPHLWTERIVGSGSEKQLQWTKDTKEKARDVYITLNTIPTVGII
jgi:hypothetical protein